MQRLSAGIISVALAGACLAPSFALAASSELHLTATGELSAKSLTIIQKAGNNLFTRAAWENAFIRIVVLLNTSTAITKNYGEKSTADDIKEGHVIDVEGTLATGADGIIVNAAKVRDVALVRESKSVAGIVKSIDAPASSITVRDAHLGATTVFIPTSAPIKKGIRTITFSDIVAGDKIISAPGTYDYQTSVLTASSVEVYQEKNVFTPRNFEGELKSVAGTTLPTTLVVGVGGKEYTVYLGAKAVVLSKNRSATNLKRFAEGDAVRFYGAIRQTNLSEVDAEIVRDLNF